MMLGILLANQRDVERVSRYAKAAHAQGIGVQIFVTFEGVLTLSLPVWEEICLHATVFACAQTVHSHQIKAHKSITLGSQFDHAEIANLCDRYLSFV